MKLPIICAVVLLFAQSLNSAEPTCEAQRDRVQVRLDMVRETLERREAQLADLAVRYAQLENEIKALKGNKPEAKTSE